MVIIKKRHSLVRCFALESGLLIVIKRCRTIKVTCKIVENSNTWDEKNIKFGRQSRYAPSLDVSLVPENV